MSPACAAGRCWECSGCVHWCHSKVARDGGCPGEGHFAPEHHCPCYFLYGAGTCCYCDLVNPEPTVRIVLNDDEPISDDDTYSITPEGLEALKASAS